MSYNYYDINDKGETFTPGQTTDKGEAFTPGQITDKGETFIPNQTNSNDLQYLDNKYKNVTNVSQIPNYYIKQPNQNTFIFKCSCRLIGIIFAFFIFSGFLFLLISVILFGTDDDNAKDDGNDSYVIFYFIIAIVAFCTIILLYGILIFPLRETVYFEDTGFRIVTVIVFFCIHKIRFYKYQDLSIHISIDLENNKIKSVNLYVKENNRNLFMLNHNFTLEEAEYFKYVAMKYIGTRM